MIKLYGLKMSNYYSLTKALLIEKGIDFEEIKAPPSQDEEYLTRSPMGKMPSIEVDGRYMSESIAIFTYLEKLQPGCWFKQSIADVDFFFIDGRYYRDREAGTMLGAEQKKWLKEALKSLSVKDAAAKVAEDCGLGKRDLYQRALVLKGK